MSLVIYSTATGRVRRIIKNSLGESFTNNQLLSNHPIRAGESKLNVRDTLTMKQIEDAVVTASGKIPSNDRYVVIDNNGDVVNIIIADPLTGDSIQNHTLVAHNDAKIGWRQMSDGSFQRSIEEIEYDILVEKIKKTRIVSTKSRTQAQANAIQAQNLLEATAALILLEEEKISRLTVR